MYYKLGLHLDGDHILEDENENNIRYGRNGSRRVSQAQFYAYVIQSRTGQDWILRAGRLFQQYVVDNYACVEQCRLNFIRYNQRRLRIELYSGLQDAISNADNGVVNPGEVGQRYVLPSSFSGGPRQMTQLYQDAMAIVRYVFIHTV